MTEDAAPAIRVTEDPTGTWKMELINFPEVEKALGREVLNAFCRCFVHSDRLTSMISCIHASEQHHGANSAAHRRDHLSMVWFTIGTLRELARAIGIAHDALYKRGALDPKSKHWAILRALRRRWDEDEVFRKSRDRAAFHVDPEIIDKGLDELVKHHVVELAEGQGEKNIDSALTLGDLALLLGLGLNSAGFRAFIDKVSADHFAAVEAVQLAFYDAARAAGVSHD